MVGERVVVDQRRRLLTFVVRPRDLFALWHKKPQRFREGPNMIDWPSVER